MLTQGLIYQKTITMITVSCCRCGCVFGMPSDLNQKFLDDSTMYFYCPNGHSQHYSEDTVTKLKKELAKAKESVDYLKQQRNNAEDAQRRAEIELKKNKTRLRNVKTRVANGVCPCCNRTFVNLQRHMHTKHPDFNPVEINT